MTTRAAIPWARPKLFGNEEALVLEALRSTWISGGPFVERLETEIAQHMGVAHAVAVSNGTTALELALRGLGIQAGDEVIVPAFTFVAPVNMVLALGAVPLFADIDPETFLIRPDEIARLAGPRTRAVIAVHLYGNVAEMEAIGSAARRAGLAVVEDAAEAAFSRRAGRFAGTMGTVGTFSLHATKTITTGEGGLVVTGDRETAERMRVLRDHGMRPDRRYWHDTVGFNFRLTNLQAALGCGQLANIGEIVADRQRIHRRYRAALTGAAELDLQHFPETVEPVLWAMTVRLRGTDPDSLRARRDAIIAALAADGIETRPGFYSLDCLPPYACPLLPQAALTSAAVIALPTYLGLSDEEIDFICGRVLHHAASDAP